MSARFLEWYSTNLWPLHRRFVRGMARRCRRCAVSERCSALGGDGLCAACREIRPEADPKTFDGVAAQTKFDGCMRAIVGSGRRYDIAILLSGGKDSAYITYRLHAEYPGLRILCLAVDNGVMDPIALQNCTLTAETVGVDLLVLRSCVPTFRDIFRSAFLGIGKRGSYEVVDYADGQTIHDLGRETATALGIPLIASGLTWVQLDRILGIRDGFLGPDEGRARFAYPLAVWRTDERTIREEVRRLRLLKPGHVSPLATNNALILPMVVLDMLNLGYCSFEPEIGQLIREGKADHRTWRNAFESLEYGVRTGFLLGPANRQLARIGLTIETILDRIRTTSPGAAT